MASGTELDTESKITAESRLVMACVRYFTGTGDIGAMRESVRDIQDWGAVMELAREHWVEPLMAWYLKTGCADLLEPRTIANLDGILRYCTASHLMLCLTLRNVLGILVQHNIAVVPVKGPVLAEMLCNE